jgi:hypothetical protein
MKKKDRRKRSEERLEEIQSLARIWGVSIVILNLYPTHVRLWGNGTTIDYWPSTSKAWELNTSGRAKVMTPAEVLALVSQNTSTPLDEEFRQALQ